MLFLFVSVHKPWCRGRSMVDTKLMCGGHEAHVYWTADSTVVHRQAGPSKASDLPPSHNTEEPELGRGLTQPQLPCPPLHPWPALPGNNPATGFTCVRSAKNKHPAQKWSKSLFGHLLPQGSAGVRPRPGWADRGTAVSL